MYEILEHLPEKHVTATTAMTQVSARCCRCGVVRIIALQHAVRANRMQRKRCPSCRATDAHRMTGTRFYRIWRGMVSRATNPDNKDFARYGAVGRDVCEAWLDFRNFYCDMFSGYADDLTLDRENNALGYSKGNCRWVPNLVQQSNKNNNRAIRYQGEDMHLAEFCRRAEVTRGAITPYLNQGLSGDEALAAYLQSPYPRYRAPR